MFAYAKPEQKQTSKGTAQKKESSEMPAYLNQTGIPDDMKSRFENLSGFSFDDVRVHYNSDKPAQLQALAYTQGKQVYVAPGQERHLGHELGHVVQQKAGIVRSNSSVGHNKINNAKNLEHDAEDTRFTRNASTVSYSNPSENTVIQMMRIDPYVPGTFMEDPSFETTELNTEELQEVINRSDDYPLSQSGMLILQMIIYIRNTAPDSRFEIEYGSTKENADEAHRISKAHLSSLDSSTKDYLRSMASGNDPKSLTNQKDSSGGISKKTSQQAENLHQAVNDFYFIAQQLPSASSELVVYRGLRIKRTEDIESVIRNYSDILPCSTSWSLNAPLEFAETDSPLQDSLLLKLIIPPSFPLISASSPRKEVETETSTKPINQSQEEVLLGAYRVNAIERIDTIQKKDNNFYFAAVHIVPIESNDVHAAIDNAIGKSNSQIISWGEVDLSCNFYEGVAKELIKLLKGEKSKYAVGKMVTDIDENGPYVIAKVADGKIEFKYGR